MLISKGEKIHVVHRRLFEKDTRKHFVGEVEGFDHGILRAVGNVYVIEDVKENFVPPQARATDPHDPDR